MCKKVEKMPSLSHCGWHIFSQLIDLRLVFLPTHFYVHPRVAHKHTNPECVRSLFAWRRRSAGLFIFEIDKRRAADVDWLPAEGRKKKFSETNYRRARGSVGEKLPLRLNWLIIWRQASQSAAVQTLQRVFAICLRPVERVCVQNHTSHAGRNCSRGNFDENTII
jgi:hypothetical protein